jgi:hypothetical protein
MNQPTVSPPWPSFLDAYLVAADSMGAPPVGVVRKDRNVGRSCGSAFRAISSPARCSQPATRQGPG